MLHLHRLNFLPLGNLCMLHLQLMFCLLDISYMLHLHRLMFRLLSNLHILCLLQYLICLLDI